MAKVGWYKVDRRTSARMMRMKTAIEWVPFLTFLKFRYRTLETIREDSTMMSDTMAVRNGKRLVWCL